MQYIYVSSTIAVCLRCYRLNSVWDVNVGKGTGPNFSFSPCIMFYSFSLLVLPFMLRDSPMITLYCSICMRDIGMHCISSLWRERWSRFLSLSLVDFGLWRRALKAAPVGFPNSYSETSSNSLQNLSKKLLIAVKKMHWRIRVKRIRLCKLIGPLPGGWQSREGV